MYKCFSFALIAMVMGSCAGGKKNEPTLEDFSWLLGTWQWQSERDTIYEVWSRSSDTLFSGVSFRVVQRDTVILETIALRAGANGIFLCPRVVNQNQGEPVTFELVGQTEKSATFENPEHDFPTRIAYERTADSVIVAEISGKQDGNSQCIRFEMRRR